MVPINLYGNYTLGIFSVGAIAKCLNLRVLDLSSNYLSSVSELASLSSLERLDLSNNNISKLGWCTLAVVQNLFLPLFSLYSDGFDKLESLTRLALAGNKLSRFVL